MFEKEIKFISDFCLNKVKQLGSSFAFEKLAGTDLHPAITRYISAELDFMIYSDRKKLLEQSYFDYTGKQINQHFGQISEEIKRSKKISLDDTEKLIVQAVSFNANFVVRPKWSLIKLIYNDQNSINVDELEVMLKYVYYYDYIKNVLGAYLSKRKVVQLSLTEFELILNKIDRELFKTNTEQLIDNALNSIGDFFNIGGTDKTAISAMAVEILLKEKNLIDHLMKLRKTAPDSAKKKFTVDEIKKILYSAATVEESTMENISEKEAIIEEEKEVETEELLTAEDIEKSFKADDTETKPDEDDDTDSIGLMADQFASEMDDAGLGNFLTEEDEEKLLSLYDEELDKLENDLSDSEMPIESNELDTEIKDETLNDIPGSVEPFYEEEVKNEESVEAEQTPEEIKPGSEKDIVDEMIRDFIGDDVEKTEQPLEESIETESEIIENELELEKDVSKDNEQENITKPDASLEDELFEVFEELDNLDKEPPNEIITEDEEPMSEFDMIDKDLESIEEIAFGDEFENETTIVEEEINAPPQNLQEEEVKEVEVEEPKPVEVVEEKPKPQLREKPVNKKEEQLEEIPVRKKDLLSYLKRKETKKIISYIFAGDREDFVTTAERIMECRGYKDASEIIRSVFSSYKISHYSKEAITLTNAVSNYFRQA